MTDFLYMVFIIHLKRNKTFIIRWCGYFTLLSEV